MSNKWAESATEWAKFHFEEAHKQALVLNTLFDLRAVHKKGVSNCTAYANLDCADATDAKHYLKMAAKHQLYVDALTEVLEGGD